MRILVAGGDGYLGWPTAMHLASHGHEVICVDNYLRRNIAREVESEPLFECPNLRRRAEIFEAETGYRIKVHISDLRDFRTAEKLMREYQPEVLIHYAEQPSAPYSMLDFSQADLTLKNNLGVTFNLIWAILNEAPDCHMVKLGTMGEYGTPNIDIEEGWIEIEHKGRKDKFLYPRQAGSLYHTTKVLDTDLIWFYCRTRGLRVTDLMQGPVYGLSTPETVLHADLKPFFHYDDIFGTLLNRFLVQAVSDVPLTVYGKGGQTRGYLDLRDTLQCVELAANQKLKAGEMQIFNQFVEQFSVNQLADRVQNVGKSVGLNVQIKSIENPRKEAEDHYYNAQHSGLLELGLKPHFLTDEVIAEMLETVVTYKDRIDKSKIFPRVRW